MKKNVFSQIILMFLLYLLLTMLFSKFSIQKSLAKINLKLQNTFSKTYGMIFSYYLYIPFIVITVLISFFIQDSYLNKFSIIILLISQTYLNSFLKLISFEYRPYQILDSLKSFDCEKDFGMPSGHLFFLGTALVILKEKIIYKNYDSKWEEVLNSNNEENFNFNFSPIKKDNRKYNIVINLISLVIFIIVSLARMTNGAHSLTQCLFGFFFGIYISLIYFNYLEFNLKLFVMKLINKENIVHKNTIIKVFIIIIILPLFFNQLIFFRKNDENYNNALQNIIKNNCTTSNIKYDLSLNIKNFFDCIFVLFIIFSFCFLHYFKYEFVNKFKIRFKFSFLINYFICLIPIIGTFTLYFLTKNKILLNGYYLFGLIKALFLFFIVLYYFTVYPLIMKWINRDNSLHFKYNN